MNFVKVETDEGIATVVLNRGKVNALNGEVVNELRESLKALEVDKDLKTIVLTGYGKFFSFGSSVFAGSTEMLRFCIGSANATKVLYSGAMYSAEEAMSIGLVNSVLTEKNLLVQADCPALKIYCPVLQSVQEG
jgi:enoyl-CoA hydratase/carnithine racemase